MHMPIYAGMNLDTHAPADNHTVHIHYTLVQVRTCLSWPRYKYLISGEEIDFKLTYLLALMTGGLDTPTIY